MTTVLIIPFYSLGQPLAVGAAAVSKLIMIVACAVI